jgi:type I restriction enzyme M protein
MASDIQDIEQNLWDAADELRANSKLRMHQYSTPVLGLIFLKYADVKFQRVKDELEEELDPRQDLDVSRFKAEGVVYLPAEARFSRLIELPEDVNLGKEINEAMKAIETENPELEDVLPKSYHELGNDVLVELLKNFNSIPDDIEGDAFGKIYEYFLGKFADAEGQRAGEFFTPTSIVKLIVDVIEPYHGRIYDPACGSGGMFVQSANFIQEHQENPSEEISIYGQEKTAQTVRLCKMNLAVHGLEGEIMQGNSYYNDVHDSHERFDYVMANPPFNVSNIDEEKLKEDPRFPFGIPSGNSIGNYVWIQMFYSALNEDGRAGFVMANSAADARHSEKEIRKQLIEENVVDVMIAVGSDFFYNVSLPCTLWFLDKDKQGTDREDEVLFIDARDIYHQVERAQREFHPHQIEFLANIARLYRGEDPEFLKDGTEKLFEEHFDDAEYEDVPGLCGVATLDEIEEQDWSLNPGRYVGVEERDMDDVDFDERLNELNDEFQQLTDEAHQLEDQITENVREILSEKQ